MPFGSIGSHTSPVATYAATGTPRVKAPSRAAALGARTAAVIHDVTRMGSAAATSKVALSGVKFMVTTRVNSRWADGCDAIGLDEIAASGMTRIQALLEGRSLTYP